MLRYIIVNMLRIFFEYLSANSSQVLKVLDMYPPPHMTHMYPPPHMSVLGLYLSANSSQVLKVLEEARALRKQLLHADQTVRELTEALTCAQFASLAARKVGMQQAEIRKSHYTVSW
jgi:hypothetical protein